MHRPHLVISLLTITAPAMSLFLTGCRCGSGGGGGGPEPSWLLSAPDAPAVASIGTEVEAHVKATDVGSEELQWTAEPRPQWLDLAGGPDAAALSGVPPVGASVGSPYQVVVTAAGSGGQRAVPVEVRVDPLVIQDLSHGNEPVGYKGDRCFNVRLANVPALKTAPGTDPRVRVWLDTASLQNGDKWTLFDDDANETILAQKTIWQLTSTGGPQPGEVATLTDPALVQRVLDGRFDICVFPKNDQDPWHLMKIRVTFD